MRRLLGVLYDRMDSSILLQSVRNGLIKIIPVLLIGSFALVLQSLPIPFYQSFIHNFLGGFFYNIVTIIYNATFGLLAFYMTISIAISHGQQGLTHSGFSYGPVFASVVSFGIFAGVLSKDFNIDAFGVKGMFTAIICALVASQFYNIIYKRFSGRARLYADGADVQFNEAISTLIPIGIVVIVFAIINFLLTKAFHVNGFQELFINSTNYIFANLGRSLGTAILYVLLVSVLWFFGVHGSDVLEGVNQHLFDGASGILNKTFFDTFVLMGGCGTAMCLLIALLIFSKRRSNHNLAKFAVFPMVFNISELMVFGLPVVFNPLLVVPFIVTPLVMVLTSYTAMTIGIVPNPVASVEWTTPILISGYLATKSFAGAVLQLVNLCIGVLIYMPFVKIFDAEKERNSVARIKNLTDILKESEDSREPVSLLGLHNTSGQVARDLAIDLEYSLNHGKPRMLYQPQVDYRGNTVGVEALFRWHHGLYGDIYPPLVMKIAEEYGCLGKLEEAIYNSVISEMDMLLEKLGEDAKISINITGNTIQTDAFEKYLTTLKAEKSKYISNICIEITEQATFNITSDFIERLTRIHDMGYKLAIDDFSMGNTSVKYLQNNVFDFVKLDGSLVRDAIENERSMEIIHSISNLSRRFGISVVAEYVETEQEKEGLYAVGCTIFQGYLFSPAVKLDELKTLYK